MSSIGIKIANGEFYPILTENESAKKRMVLTTAHDGQRSVQIDLYRSETRTMSDAQYIGSLVIEKLKTAKKQGDPSVELVISQNETGELSAEAKDLNNPHADNDARLSIALTTLDVADADFTNFGIESEMDAVADLQTKTGMGHLIAEQKKQKRSAAAPLVAILVTFFVLAGAFCAWWFFLKDRVDLPFKLPFAEKQSDSASPPNSESGFEYLPPPVEEALEQLEEAVIEPEVEVAVVVPEVIVPIPEVIVPEVEIAPPPRIREARVAPVFSYPVPNPIPAGGTTYKVRYGDTLWDISQAFYRNPWRYKFLARINNINNANQIISGRTIRIPKLP